MYVNLLKTLASATYEHAKSSGLFHFRGFCWKVNPRMYERTTSRLSNIMQIVEFMEIPYLKTLFSTLVYIFRHHYTLRFRR